MTATSDPTPEEIVDEFIARMVAMDVDGACELVTADVEYDNVPMGKNYGPDGIKAILAPMIAGVQEVEFVIHRQVAQGNLVMNERNDRFRAGDQWFDIPVMGVFEVTDGRVSLWRDYFDLRSFEDQLATLVG